MAGASNVLKREEGGGGGPLEVLERYFKFEERGTNILTESRAGVTTFMVMAYIIFVNPIILTPLKLDPVAVAAGTCLVAGVMTIAMGLFSNYPFAIAAGMGLNAIVAALPNKGYTPEAAMGVIVVEGLVIFALVVVGLREAIMNAVPLSLKRAIGVGIGLFILYLGFSTAGIIKNGALVFPTEKAQFVFFLGLGITVLLYVMKIRAALIISIAVTSVVAFLAGVTKVPDPLTVTPTFNGLFRPDVIGVFNQVAIITALLTVFSIMLSDFFDTMGTVTGIAAEAGLAKEDGSVPGIGRILMVDSLAAAAGGTVGISSNTTYIESAAGVAEGGRTGFTSVVVGVLFLVAILLSPLANLVPSVATGPALVIVGYLMFTLIKDIPVADVEDGLPALLTIILMPLTSEITVGIGAGFIAWTLIKVVRRKWAEIHPLMWLVSAAFVVFFADPWIQTFIK